MYPHDHLPEKNIDAPSLRSMNTWSAARARDGGRVAMSFRLSRSVDRDGYPFRLPRRSRWPGPFARCDGGGAQLTQKVEGGYGTGSAPFPCKDGQANGF